MSSIADLAAAAGVALSLSAPSHPGLPKERTYRPAHHKPVGTIIDIHGGRWKQSSPQLIDTGALFSIQLAKWGWKVVVPSFRGGRLALPDLRATLTREARRAHGKPVCTTGESSGGHLALMLATDKRVTCAISQAGPVDLTVTNPSPGDDRGTILSAQAIWGSGVRAMSPVTVAPRTHAAVLMLSAIRDTAAPSSRANRYAARAPHAANVAMRAGSGRQVTWEHAPVNSSALTCAGRVVHRVLRAAVHGRAAAYRALGPRRQVC
jgi:acetyl esterase/lipase